MSQPITLIECFKEMNPLINGGTRNNEKLREVCRIAQGIFNDELRFDMTINTIMAGTATQKEIPLGEVRRIIYAAILQMPATYGQICNEVYSAIHADIKKACGNDAFKILNCMEETRAALNHTEFDWVKNACDALNNISWIENERFNDRYFKRDQSAKERQIKELEDRIKYIKDTIEPVGSIISKRGNEWREENLQKKIKLNEEEDAESSYLKENMPDNSVWFDEEKNTYHKTINIK